MKFTPYVPRQVRFVAVNLVKDWQIKTYALTKGDARIDEQVWKQVSGNLPDWLKNSRAYSLPTYKIATLIVHQGSDGIFAILSWWIDQNMLQVLVYKTDLQANAPFELYSDQGIVTCVWEMAVLWFERNVWVEHILSKAHAPDFESYLNVQMNGPV